jgi:hypothetical protein
VKFARLLAQGHDPAEIIRGAERLARTRRDEDPRFTPQAITWLNQERWTEHPSGTNGADAPPSRIADSAEWGRRLIVGRQRKQWPRDVWGPAPGETGCLVPPELIQPGDGVDWIEWRRESA